MHKTAFAISTHTHSDWVFQGLINLGMLHKHVAPAHTPQHSHKGHNVLNWNDPYHESADR